MRKAKAIILLSVILASLLYTINQAPTVKAFQGSAKVYIICLSDVPHHNYGEGFSHEPKIRVKQGAIDAIKFQEKYDLPYVHPLQGKSPPYYGIEYQVISDWSTYRSIIVYFQGAIVINTHGETLPIPSGYNPITWIGKIAEAMLTRRLTWVHTGGYPFYWIWQQGATTPQTWPSDGTYGFKNFTKHINLPNVTCWPPDPQERKIYLNEDAEKTLEDGWKNITLASYAERGRPLKASDFKNYTILCIWGTEDAYMTGAVIAFVKPSERALPKDRRGFGAYVHIGTRKTFNSGGGETDGNYTRGYIGAAAALWTETGTFESITYYEEYTDPWYGSYFYTLSGFTVTPVITYYSYIPNTGYYHINIDFGIYGFLKSNTSDWIDKVSFYLKPSSDCFVMMWTNRSKNGYKEDKPTIHVDWIKVLKVGISTFLFFLSPDPYSKLGQATKAIGGVMLFSDWWEMLPTVKNSERGVDKWDQEVSFEYDPVEYYYTDDSPYYHHYNEFESIIHIECRVNMANRRQWTILPIDFCVSIISGAAYKPYKWSRIYIAIFRAYDPENYVASIFFDDLKNLGDWSLGDSNSAAGYDYWGWWDRGESLQCAGVGTNSLYGEKPNVDVDIFPYYDKCMNAHLMRSVDLRPYRSSWLRCDLTYLFVEDGDYIAIDAYYNNVWNNLATYSGMAGPGVHPIEFPIPTSTTLIRFRFFSNDDNNIGWGAFLDYVEIRAELPNDANSMTDAGDTFSTATHIGQGSFAGYLNYDEDWYSFTVTSNDIGKYIYFTLSPPSNANFKAELYDPNNQRRAGPSEEIVYRLSTADPLGNWRIRIYPEMGFGQYSFGIKITTTPPPEGGGCPFLFVWNGRYYAIKNNILPASEQGSGIDVKDYYLLQGKPVPIYQDSTMSLYSFLIAEFEKEHSYIDHLMLIAVDHEPETNIAVTEEGEIVTYKNPTPPLLCIDNHGESRLSEVRLMDGDLSDPSTFFYGKEGDWLILNFGKVNASTANLIIRSDMKSADVCIEIQIPSEKGWQTINVHHPRDYWSITAINLTTYIPKDKDLLIRLLWTSPHRLDYVGLDITPQENYTIRKGKPILALHSTEGNILPKIIQSDDKYAELTPGQSIQIIFAIPNPKPEKITDFIFYAEGHYYSIETQPQNT